jgi:peptidoglycan/LPS O-acetylase OafA/YrhL
MNQPRSNGLDTLRALAIVLVFMYHYMVFVSGETTFGWASTVGWVGVDLFFVLSGYLIGHQVFAGMAAQRRLSLSSFYARRALRTWPVFWVVLAAYFLFPSVMGGREPVALWRFLTFTQNYQLQPGTAFSHAWSLCIEEQFYLVLPLVVWCALRMGTRRYQAWALLFALLAAGIAARAALWAAHGRDSVGSTAGYYPNIYYATLCRFDEFLPGIAIAMIRSFHPLLWRRLMERGAALFWFGVVAVGTALYGVHSHYYIEGYGYPFFMTVFGYSCVAAAFSLLVASALSERSPLHFVCVPGAQRLALWSYSIYLSHKAVAHILDTYATEHALAPSLKLLAITAASLAVGAVLYRLVELPFMNLRDKRFPSLFHVPLTAAGEPVRP